MRNVGRQKEEGTICTVYSSRVRLKNQGDNLSGAIYEEKCSSLYLCIINRRQNNWSQVTKCVRHASCVHVRLYSRLSQFCSIQLKRVALLFIRNGRLNPPLLLVIYLHLTSRTTFFLEHLFLAFNL